MQLGDVVPQINLNSCQAAEVPPGSGVHTLTQGFPFSEEEHSPEGAEPHPGQIRSQQTGKENKFTEKQGYEQVGRDF